MKQQLHNLQSMPKAIKISIRLISKLLTILFLLSTNVTQAQFLSSAPSLTATPTDGIYGSYGNATPYFMGWDANNLYIGKTGGASGEALFIYLDIDPNAPASGGVSGGSNTNGNLTTTTDYGVTATLPFRADLRIVITPTYLGYSTRNGSGGWNTEVDISSGNVGTSGGSVRSAKIPWTTGGLLGSRPAAFNWLGYAAYTTGVYDVYPTNNTSGGGASPRFYFYQTVTNTTNTSTTNPFSTSQRSFETRDNYGYNNTQPSPIFDFTVNGNTTTFTNTLTVINNFHIASGTFTNLSSGGASTLTMGSGSTNTPSIRCDGTLTPNNGTGNDLSVVAAFGTTTIAGSAANTAYRLFNLTVNNGATVQAPSSGTVDLGWQFGTITVNSGGILNFVNGSGVVNSTILDLASNTVSISNAGSMTFNNLTINGTTNLQAKLQPVSTGNHNINIKGNLVRTGTTNFSTNNSSGNLNITMNGTTAQTLPTGGFRNLTISNTSANVTTTGTLTLTNTSGYSLTVDAGARLELNNNLDLGSGGNTANINGFLRLSSSSRTVTGTASQLQINNGATYEHNVTGGGAIPSATWNTGSTCLIMGSTTSGPASGLNQSFYNFTWNCPSQSGSGQLGGKLTTVTNLLSVVNTGSSTLRLMYSSDSTAAPLGNYTANIANISISGGTLAITGGAYASVGANQTAVTSIVNVSGNVTLSNSSLLDFNASSSFSSSIATLNIAGNLTMGASNTIRRNSTITANLNFNKSSGAQTFTQNGGTILNTINWNFGTTSPTTSPTVTLGSNASMGPAVLTINSVLDCSTYTFAITSAPTVNGTLRTANLTTTSIPSSFTFGSGTVEFYGTGSSVTMTGGSSSGTTITVASTTGLLVGQNLYVASGTGRFSTGAVVTVASITNGTQFVASATPSTTLSGATILAITTASIPSNTYNNLLVTGNPLISQSTTINGNLTVSGSGTLYIDNAANNRTLTVAGNISVSGTGGIAKTDNGGSTNSILLTGTSKTITCTASGNDFSKQSITINSPATYTLSSDLDYSTALSNRVIDGTGSLDISGRTVSMGNANLTVAALTTNSSTVINTNSTTGAFTNGVTLNGTVNYTKASSGTPQLITAATYNNLGLTGSSPKKLSGTITINGNLSITSGGAFSDSTFDTNIKGNWTRGSAGTYTPGSGTVNFNGSGSSQTIAVTGGGTASYTNLSVANSSGVSLSSNTTISGLLTLTSGNLDVNGQVLTLAGTLSATSSIIGSGTGSTVVVSGLSSIPSGLFTSNIVRNLTVNRAGGVVMASDLTVTGVYTATSGKLSIGSNTLTLNGTVSGMSGSNSLVGSNSSKLTVTSTTSVGTLFFDQTTSADGTVTTGTNALQNLVVSGSGGSVTLGNKVNLFERLSVGSGTTFNTGDSLVLRSIAGSSSNNTAYVDQVGGTINGQVRVERYIHSQSRGWRAFTSPVTYSGLQAGTVKENWQNSWGLSNNYGTRVTGPSATNGLDDVSVSASLMKYNSTSGAWTNITNTTTETIATTDASAANKSFFMFVRGDRTVTPNGYTPGAFVSTTIPARGKLQTGTQVFNFTGAANKAWLVGNPYACPVDMSTVTFSSNIPDQVYVWDPNRPSSYSDVTGAYVTFDRTTWGAPTAGSTTQYFQTGQCFFVVPTSGSGVSVTFNESNKSAGNQNNQTSGTGNGLSDIFNVKLNYVRTDGSKAEIDGIRAKFGANFSAAVTAEDAYKWATAGIENMSLKRNSSLLSIEARPYITTTDSLFFNITNLSVGANYEFKVNPINFDASVSSCKLVDKFLNTETPISLTNTTLVSFNVTSVTGSNAANRFYVVFNAAGNLPTSNSLTVKAYKQNNSVKIDWEAIAENNVKTYSVEKSTDASSFTKLSEATAKNGNTTNAYSIVDNNPVIGVNYYRIQSTATNNNKAYSAIVRVEMSDKGIKSITVYPNPVKSSTNTIGLQMNNLTAGKYTAVLYNVSGQQVWMNTMNHNGNNGSTSLQLNKTLASGTYQLQLTDSKGNSFKQTVLVVE